MLTYETWKKDEEMKACSVRRKGKKIVYRTKKKVFKMKENDFLKKGREIAMYDSVIYIYIYYIYIQKALSLLVNYLMVMSAPTASSC